MTGSHAGLRALVTGGASGIGAATASALLDAGALVACLDRQVDGVPDGCTPVVVDLRDGPAVGAAVVQAGDVLGGLDVVVANAGVGAQGTVEDGDDELWHEVWDVNVLGVVRTVRAALPLLRRSSSAVVVVTTSVAARTGLPRRALYSATKGALVSLSLAMAADHLADGVRVVAVSPGTADTPWVGRLLEQADNPAAERTALEARQPLGRLVTPQEVAAAVAYASSPAAASTTGVEIVVDGGLSGLRVPPR